MIKLLLQTGDVPNHEIEGSTEYTYKQNQKLG